MTIGQGNGKKVNNRNRLPGFHEYRDRHGRLRRYYRRTGQPLIPLPDGDTSSPEFLEAYITARKAGGGERAIGAQRTLSGTINAAIAGYYGHALWTDKLSDGSRRVRRGILEKFREADGDKPIGKIRQEDIERRLSKAPASTARNHLVALRGLFQYALRAKLIKEDPTVGVEAANAPRAKGDDDDPNAEDGWATWTDEWIDQFEAYWPVGSKPRLVFALALETGQRRGDVCRMGPGMVKNGVMTLLPQKTKKSGKRVRIPLSPELKRVIAGSATGIKYYILSNRGDRYGDSGLGAAFASWCDEAGLPEEAVFHGLRKAFCRRGIEDGMTEDMVMSMSGHASSKVLRKSYLQQISQEKLAHQAVAIMAAARASRRAAQ